MKQKMKRKNLMLKKNTNNFMQKKNINKQVEKIFKNPEGVAFIPGTLKDKLSCQNFKLIQDRLLAALEKEKSE